MTSVPLSLRYLPSGPQSMQRGTPPIPQRERSTSAPNVYFNQVNTTTDICTLEVCAAGPTPPLTLLSITRSALCTIHAYRLVSVYVTVSVISISVFFSV